jgi:hypothetical protein
MTAFDNGNLTQEESNGSRIVRDTPKKCNMDRVLVFLNARQFVEPNAILLRCSA